MQFAAAMLLLMDAFAWAYRGYPGVVGYYMVRISNFLVILCVAFVLTASYLDWGGSKVLAELESNGALKFTFQYLYYLFETALFLLIIVYGQKAFEKWIHRENIPYGGIVVALTWGMAHWLTKGSLSAGLFSAVSGFCFGVVYLLLNRNIKWTYVVLCIMFIL